MLDLIRKRHEGPSWIVVSELGNSTGGNIKRHADAVAMGLWPSRGYEIHGYECKASRGDVRKELDDPSKADAVGKFCDYWWLAVEDLKIIDGLVIPDMWGILYPKNRILRAHRKAPKRKATEVNRGFIAALIRKVCERWVPKHEHEELKNGASEKLRAEVERELKHKRSSAERDLRNALEAIERFEKHSGVELTRTFGGDEKMVINSWETERIAEAVKVVIAARERVGRSMFCGDDPAMIVEQELRSVERAIEHHETAIGNRRAAAGQLRALIDQLRTSDRDATVHAPDQEQLSLLPGIDHGS